ncbi:MarC family protein [Myroides sp. LJL119]
MFQSFFQHSLTSFMTIFPVLNPIGVAFIVNSFFTNLSRDERNYCTKRLVYFSFALCVISLLLGQLILMVFHLSIPIVQVGGGFLICKTALDLLNDKSAGQKTSATVQSDTTMRDKLFYPLTFPIVVDAGTISVIFALAASSYSKKFEATVENFGAIMVGITLCCLLFYVFTYSAFNITQRIGANGANVINKMCAFFTFCVGLNVIYEGIMSLIKLHAS